MTEDPHTLSTEEKVGQLFFIGISGPDIDEDTGGLLRDITPGGICLFARNIREAAQTRELTDRLRDRVATLPMISIDQEGGLVDRLRRVVTPMPAANTIADAAEAAELARLISESLRILGVNMDFAPVVDVIDDGRRGYSNGLVSRTFGNSPESVTELAGEFLRALQDKGILGCLKHFPGLGASQVDSHEELPAVVIPEAELWSKDLYPYKSLLSSEVVKAIMVAHAAYPMSSLQESDENGGLLPSSLSHNFITSLLRGRLGFDGLVITDDLEMGAIVKSYGIGDACKRALNAGADMLAICADPAAIRDGYRSVLAAVNKGEIGSERIARALDRIAKTKQLLSEPLPFDRSRLAGISGEVAELVERSLSTSTL